MPSLAGAAQQLVEFRRLARVEAGGRLVQAQQHGSTHSGAGDLDAALDAVGRAAGGVVGGGVSRGASSHIAARSIAWRSAWR